MNRRDLQQSRHNMRQNYNTDYSVSQPLRRKKASRVLFITPPGGPTVSICVEHWLQRRRSTLRPSSFDKYYHNLTEYIIPFWGDLSVGSITEEKITQFISVLSDEKRLSSGTIRDILSVFYQVLEENKNKAASIPHIYPKIERKESRVLSQKEHQNLLNTLLQCSDSASIAVLLALSTGLRIGEICGLQWQNVSADFTMITVQQAVERIRNYDTVSASKTKIVVGPPKSRNSRRTIPVSDHVAEKLVALGRNDPQIFLFSGTDSPPDPRRIQRRLVSVLAECGLEGVHFHTLRHSFATRCVECGVDVKTLSTMLGHSDISVTMNTYVHPSDTLKRNAIEKLKNQGFC